MTRYAILLEKQLEYFDYKEMTFDFWYKATLPPYGEGRVHLPDLIGLPSQNSKTEMESEICGPISAGNTSKP